MIKICYVIGTLEIGGAEKQLLKLVENIDKKIFSPVVIALRGGALKEEFEKAVKLVVIGKRWKIDPFFFFKLILVIKKEKPDILHTFMFTSNTWGRLAGLLSCTPVIISSERCVDIWKKWYHKLIDKFLLLFTKKVVANSSSVKNFYIKTEKIPDDKIEVIYNGIDIKQFENISYSKEKKEEFNIEKAEFIIGTGGRFTEQKGFIYLIEAIPEVLKIIPECFFIFVGDGPLRRNFEKVVEKLNIKYKAAFTGYRKDILEIFSICDLIVVRSLFEGMPNVILEAMTLKKPVIGTNIPEIKELISDGENGLLVPVRNSKSIVDAIILLLKNQSSREKMGKKGYEIVKEKFSLEVMVKKYEKLYIKFFSQNNR